MRNVLNQNELIPILSRMWGVFQENRTPVKIPSKGEQKFFLLIFLLNMCK